MSSPAAHQDQDGRPVDALLARYAAGALQRPMAVLVEAHLEVSPVNRGFLRDLDALGGVLLAEAEPHPLADRDARLAAIFAAPEREALPRRAAPMVATPADPVLPAALRRYLGRGFADLSWKAKLPGLKECIVADDAEGEVSLLWIRAGQAMPSHTHSGTEATLVLRGGFADLDGHYVRGDIAVADDSVDHKPVADADEDCICFVVNDGDLRLTGPIGRIFSRFVRR